MGTALAVIQLRFSYLRIGEFIYNECHALHRLCLTGIH